MTAVVWKEVATPYQTTLNRKPPSPCNSDKGEGGEGVIMDNQRHPTINLPELPEDELFDFPFWKYEDNTSEDEADQRVAEFFKTLGQ